MNIEHISVSRALVYDKCKQEYKYKYHMKLKSPVPEKPWFKYGKAVHVIAEKYVEGRGQISINEIANDVLNKKIAIEKDKNGEDVFCPDLSRSYKDRFPTHIKNIEKITKNFGFEGRTEIPFNYDLDPPNNKIVKGFIDRLIVKDNLWIILDYKTTKPGIWRKNENTIKSDLQLRMYAKVINKQFQVDPKNIKGALFYLDDAKLVPTGFTQESIDSAERELLNIYNNIANQDPATVIGNYGDHCGLCDYNTICPYNIS